MKTKDFKVDKWLNVNQANNTRKDKNPSVQTAASDNSDIHSQVCDVIRQCREGGIDITDGYDNWLHVGMALASEFGEDGRNYFHEVSQHNGGYNLAECDDKYTNILRTGRGEVTIATFFRIAKDHGIDPSRTHTSNKKVGERSGDGCGDASKAKIDSVVAFLREEGEWRYNIIRECIEWKEKGCDRWTRVDDYVANTLWRRMCEGGMKISPNTVWAVINSDFSPQYDALRSYLSSLPQWTEGDTDYIGQFASMVHTDGHDEEFRDDFRKWFVSMVAMWMDRGINQQILVLIGAQGIYKSSWLNAILPPELIDYRSTKMDCSQMTKDDRVSISQHPVINLEELDAMTPAELNQLKALTTAVSSNERPAYGRTKICRRRIASFCGSGNNQYLLTDRTGNRRWLVFSVVSIDSPFTAEIPYEGMYSQAVSLIHSGFRYYFDTDDIKNIDQRNRSFEVPDPAVELVQSYFIMPEGSNHGLFMTATEILEFCSPPPQLGIKPQHIGAAMTKLGYRKHSTNHGNGYFVIKLHGEDRQNKQSRLASEYKDTECVDESGGSGC